MVDELEDKINEANHGNNTLTMFERMAERAVSHGKALGFAGGATLLSYALVGIGGPMTGIGFGVGATVLNLFNKAEDDKSTGVGGIIKDYTIGSLMGILGVGSFQAAAAYLADPIVRGVAGATVSNIIWSTAYVGADYLVKYGLDGLSDAYQKHWWPITKSTLLWLGLPVGLTINGYLGGYPGMIGIDSSFRVIGGVVKGSAEQNTPQYSSSPGTQSAPHTA
ncbi:MAG: hypothetical protein ABIH34_03860 [Nanoarchaeota archaeon]